MADQSAMQPVEELVALVLVTLQMAGRVKRDAADAAPLGPDPQRDLLAHRAAGHKDSSRLAEELGDLLLEGHDQLALPVAVGPGLGWGERRQIDQNLLR